MRLSSPKHAKLFISLCHKGERLIYMLCQYTLCYIAFFFEYNMKLLTKLFLSLVLEQRATKSEITKKILNLHDEA